MNRTEVRELYEHISQCACVEKGESDSREIHAKFKIICGQNLDILKAELDKWQEDANKEAIKRVDPAYAKFDQAAEMLMQAKGKKDTDKKMKALIKKYEKEIKSFDDYHAWLMNDFMKEAVELPVLKMWPFADMPEKISGGYMLAIKPMISDFPEI